MDFISLSGRDLIIGAVIVVAVYLLVSLLRLSQLGRGAAVRQDDGRARIDAGQEDAMDDGAEATELADVTLPASARPGPRSPGNASHFDDGPGPLEHWPPLHERKEPRYAPSAFVEQMAAARSSAPSNAAPADFGQQLLRQQFEQELAQLRADMQSEIESLRSAMAELQATRRVAPLYNEAMQLAQRGLPADVIADRCAISRGEAELVCALSRNQQDYPHHDENFRASGY